MSSQPEAKFKKKLCEAYEKTFSKGFHFYFPAAVKYGVPDLYFTIRGRGVWVEAKVADNVLSKIQTVQIEKMRGAGERVVIVRVDSMEAKKEDRTISIGHPMGVIDMHYLTMRSDHFWVQIGGCL